MFSRLFNGFFLFTIHEIDIILWMENIFVYISKVKYIKFFFNNLIFNAWLWLVRSNIIIISQT